MTTHDQDQLIQCIQPARLEDRLRQLYVLGQKPGHRGAWRLAFSAADRRGRDYVGDLMRQSGLEPRVDAAGNLIGARSGENRGLPAIIIGSHIDTVPGGGMFDGALGVIGGVEVLAAVNEAGVKLNHPVEVIAFSNEERSRFATNFSGSAAMVGGASASDLDDVYDQAGVPLVTAMQESGLDPGAVATAHRPTGFCRAYLELHVEQGGRLLKSGDQIGVVTAIVGITRARLTFRGFANHAGTTMLEDRRDALWPAAALVGVVREAALAQAGELVGTVGQLEVQPGAANVVPGEVTLTIELRSAAEERLAATLAALLARAEQLAAEYGVELTVSSSRVGPPVPLDPAMQDHVEAAGRALGLRTVRLASWAGHDASEFAGGVPTGMIFVPSQGGISHSPRELTTWPDAVAGVKVLAATLLRVDRHLSDGAAAKR